MFPSIPGCKHIGASCQTHPRLPSKGVSTLRAGQAFHRIAVCSLLHLHPEHPIPVAYKPKDMVVVSSSHVPAAASAHSLPAVPQPGCEGVASSTGTGYDDTPPLAPVPHPLQSPDSLPHNPQSVPCRVALWANRQPSPTPPGIACPRILGVALAHPCDRQDMPTA